MNIIPDRFTLIQRIRAAKDNVVFTVVQKARASRRLLALLGSVIFTLAVTPLGLVAIAVGLAAGPFVFLARSLWEAASLVGEYTEDLSLKAWNAATRPATDLLGW